MSDAKRSILEHFSAIPDPRREHGKLHLLADILALALCAVIAGAGSWQQIETFGQEKFAWLAQLLRLPNGIPSHDTIRRVFAVVKPHAFEQCFVAWMNACCDATGLQRIHIDGKTLKGSRRKGDDGDFAAALHLVSAWAGANHLTLGQVAVEGKSNEITAIPQLLKTLDLAGCIVSLDAMGCQKDIAKQIRQEGGDYVLAVKENQPTLYHDIDRLFAKALEADFQGYKHDIYVTYDKGHGRQETRTYLANYDPKGLTTAEDWPGLQAVVMVTRERTVKNKSSLEHSYYISSKRLSSQEYAEVIRGHWSIENGLHWILDVVFGEDANRTQEGNAAVNLALVRKIAVSLLQRLPGKDSTPTKRLRAALSETVLRQVLAPLFGQEEPLSSAEPSHDQTTNPD